MPNVRLFEADATTFDTLAPMLIDGADLVSVPITGLTGVMLVTREQIPAQLAPLPWLAPNSPANNTNVAANDGQRYEKTAPNKRRKLNKKKHKDNLPGLLFANHWKLRQSSAQLYDKVLAPLMMRHDK